MSILDHLNSAQREAAQTVAGPLLVLAGAGSGKTRVLTYRIAHLIDEQNVPSWAILAVTFTNKAAGEMRERVEQLVGTQTRWIGTFHSMCARLLRMEAEAFGLDPGFTIYDEDDRRALVRRVLQQHQVDPQALAPAAVIARISRAKNAMLDPGDMAAAAKGPAQQRLATLYQTYQQELRGNNAFDFDDLLTEMVRQFDQHPEVLARYQERFHYILVDEYQDTNRPQYLLCRQLAAAHRNFCAVGDDDQSIYQFRGADLRNILDFEQDYPEAKVVRLEQNYRSTGHILQAANAVIGNNQDRKGKALWTTSGPGELISLVQCETDRAEARYVVSTVRQLVERGEYEPGDTAVLYRTNAQSRTLEEELQRSGLPYQIVGGIRFYERKEVKDMLAYLRLLANPADDVTFQRIVNVPRRGVGDSSIQRLRRYAAQSELSLFAALARLEGLPELRGPARKSLVSFRDLLHGLAAERQQMDLAELGQAVYERSGYQAMLQDENTPEAEVRAQNIEQLISFMTEFSQTRTDPDLNGFLEEVALMAPIDETPENNQAVTLMTLHSAKGLEFPVVFIAGMEENLFPTSRCVEESRVNPLAMEEERRLCYVGITRACERLYLTYAGQRYAYGSLIYPEPSRFLSELPEELVTMQQESDPQPRRRTPAARHRLDGAADGPNRASTPPRRPAPARSGAHPARSGVHYEWDDPPAVEPVSPGTDTGDFMSPGCWVTHPRWGRGKILLREGHDERTKLTIQFGSQVKKVVAAYARLEPAG